MPSAHLEAGTAGKPALFPTGPGRLVEHAAIAPLSELSRPQAWPDFDPHHYAEVALPRRCRNAERGEFLRDVYKTMANVVTGPPPAETISP
jgi:hypothetical protein